MIATSAGRVPANTDLETNLSIKEDLRSSIAYYERHLTEIPDRLKELDREWDIERMLAVTSSALSLFGIWRGLASHRRWFLMAAAVQGFYVQHSIQGWCPPLPVLRSLGFRTPSEIERERNALKILLRESRPGGGSIVDLAEEDYEVREQRSSLH